MEKPILQAKATLPQYDRGSLQARHCSFRVWRVPPCTPGGYADILAAEHAAIGVTQK
ncbi:protein YdfI [Enterobacter cloacae]|uniref:Protein YdfI n=1 Tax=Enterobacter cloacae TaxID=550 RepID=A0A377M2K6_ENTCL|nr:protein YdfI [Enterobacter cloacae]